MLLSGWQEAVKNGSSVTLDELLGGARGGGVEFSWRAWGLRQVLGRWANGLRPERVHVLPVPDRSQGPRRHWENFAQVLGIDADAFTPPERPVNATLGAVQTELLRRLNAGIEGFSSPVDRGVWIRGYLAEQKLAVQSGERVALTDEQFDACARRSLRAIDLISSRGYAVVGDVDGLRPRPETRSGRRLDTVSEDELMRAAGGLVGMMLTDIRNRV